MKKIMALLLSLTLLITTAVNVIWATAADTPVMTVGSVEGYKGDTVEVYVTPVSYTHLDVYKRQLR